MGLPDTHRHENRHDSRHDTHRHDIAINKSPFPQLSRKFVARRISEGETGRLKEELKCQACGKGYKHVSSLAKHLWEHTPEWNVTSKLLISKHQQVQLLEAASILVSMNEEDEDPVNEGDDTIDSATGETDAVVVKTKTEAGSDATNVVDAASLKKDDTEADTEAANDSDSIENALESPEAESVSLKSLTPSYDEKTLTPAREIPILSTSSRSIAKNARSSTRRRSSAATRPLAGSLGSSLDAHWRQASPLPESLLARDLPHMTSGRRRRVSTLVPSLPTRLEDVVHREDFEDGLQDPHDSESAHSHEPHTPKHSPQMRKASPKKDDVFGMEV